ncbi:hypothetical protein Tco_1543319 [Tanacetum coccineum]
MLLAKKDKARVILSIEQNDFLLAGTPKMEELEELSANICLMARIQPSHIDSDEGPSYDSAFISEDLYELKQLTRNAYKETEKQQIIANKVKYQNNVLTKQLEQCKERDKIRALEQERDELQLKVSEQRKQILELQNAQSVLKRKMNDDEDKYLDNNLNLEAKVKPNENVIIKMSQSVQALFLLGPKSLSFYDSNLKRGLGYENPYTLKKAVADNPKLYDASCLNNSKVHVNVCDTEEILEDASRDANDLNVQ